MREIRLAQKVRIDGVDRELRWKDDEAILFFLFVTKLLNFDLDRDLFSPCFLLFPLSPTTTDWMNSPLVGGGVMPEGETEIFFSAYLDRVLSVSREK
jgi:hypothetical protein